MLLEESGFEVLEPTGGDEGLKLFLAHAVDAVVLDYLMPGMNGDVVAAKMKRINSHLPIMLLSAYGPLPKNKLRSVNTFLSKSQPPAILIYASEPGGPTQNVFPPFENESVTVIEITWPIGVVTSA